jgi:II/X family phage/plasmid replication protein
VIDWLTFVAPLEHDPGEGGPFYAGEVLSTVPDPTHPDGVALEWGVLKRRAIEGSYSARIQVQSTTDEAGRRAIWVSGNPSKWFQGHNVFGSDDLQGLALEMLSRVCSERSVTPTAAERAAWAAGEIRLSRVDVTESFDLRSLARVRSALRSLDSSANLKHRGRGHFFGDSLTFGKGSRRWSLTFYAKASEIEAHGGLPLHVAESSVPAFAAGLLRAEVRLLGLELKRLGLEYVSAWSDTTAAEVHGRTLSGLQISEASMIEADVLEGLPGRLQVVYQSWRDGHDLRAMLPRKTFYRYRLQLLAHGVDIAVKQDRAGPDLSNVVPLRVVLNAYPVRVPDWAVGTPLYFEPRQRVA